MTLFDPGYEALANGTWAKLWRARQGQPPHLIDNEASGFRCTCGYEPTSMDDWSNHVTRTLQNAKS